MTLTSCTYLLNGLLNTLKQGAPHDCFLLIFNGAAVANAKDYGHTECFPRNGNRTTQTGNRTTQTGNRTTQTDLGAPSLQYRSAPFFMQVMAIHLTLGSTPLLVNTPWGNEPDSASSRDASSVYVASLDY